MSDDQSGYELAMPFVTVTSKGGPHDDASYVAGWECGVLDVKLSDLDPLTGECHEATVHTENIPQLDLIAMKHGFRLELAPASEIPEWRHVRFMPTGERA